MRSSLLAFLSVAVSATVLGAAPAGASGPVIPKGEAAKVEIGVSPESVAPGAEAEVTVRVIPASGIKINRYPRIRLSVASQDGLVEGGDASVGNDIPPDPDHMEKNYFKTVEPVRLKLKLASQAPTGRHEIDALLRYSYCVAASGYCAPVKTPLKISLNVR